MSARVLFYVQHLLGIGHLRRAEILAEAMAVSGLDVTVALGGMPVPELAFRGAKVAELPPAQIGGGDFARLLDAEGRVADDVWIAARRSALLALAREVRPHVILIELFPFGRRQFRFELIPLLDAANGMEPPPAIACSVRDILVRSNKPGRDDEIIGVLRRYFQLILVHGDPQLIPFGETFKGATEIEDLIRYTGYVAASPEPDGIVSEPDGAGEVLVSAGGGAVGAPILAAALAARPLTRLRAHSWRFLCGPNLPETDYRALQERSDDRTVVERFRPDFSRRLARAALSISQGGYNTTMDIIRAGARAVVIPFETPGETEQRRRSDLLAAKGFFTILPAAALSPQALAASIEAELSRPRPKTSAIDLGGAANTAVLVAALAAERAYDGAGS